MNDHLHNNTSQKNFNPLYPIKPYPIIITSPKNSISAHDWVANNKEQCESILQQQGALLLRGFSPYDSQGLEMFIQKCFGDLLNYQNRSTPRTRIFGKIYSSTEYPCSEHILLHNENSYSHEWPSKLFFMCDLPAQDGGETPICDSRHIYNRIPEYIRRRFQQFGVMYVRNLSNKMGLSWQEVFQMSDRTQLKKHCSKNGIDFEFLDNDRLRIKQVLPATRKHPLTNEEVWFNQAHLFHAASLPKDVYKEFIENYSIKDLPRHAFYGDGSEIDSQTISQIISIYNQEKVCFKWQKHDILIIDNLLVAHGRNPYTGPRKIYVGMT